MGTVSLADAASIVLEAGGRPMVVARVVGLQGFSTWPGDPLVVVDEEGRQHGDLLGGPGRARIRPAALDLLAGGTGAPLLLTVDVHGAAVAEAGLTCGGQAEVLLHTVSAVPAVLWARLADRAPTALLTPLGPGSARLPVVVSPGQGAGAEESEGVLLALDLLAQGRSGRQRIGQGADEVLVEAWVPDPRLVVVGTGEVAVAVRAQASLLGWEVRVLDSLPAPDGEGWPDLEEGLAWAGASSALVVLSHDPHADTPAIGAALDAGAAYIGAMGSRRTQSRRIERLRADGRSDEQLRRVRRPIGLDLGGRSAAQMALSICAEILAVHCGREGGPLSARDAPIHDRPAAT